MRRRAGSPIREDAALVGPAARPRTLSLAPPGTPRGCAIRAGRKAPPRPPAPWAARQWGSTDAVATESNARTRPLHIRFGVLYIGALHERLRADDAVASARGTSAGRPGSRRSKPAQAATSSSKGEPWRVGALGSPVARRAAHDIRRLSCSPPAPAGSLGNAGERDHRAHAPPDERPAASALVAHGAGLDPAQLWPRPRRPPVIAQYAVHARAVPEGDRASAGT